MSYTERRRKIKNLIYDALALMEEAHALQNKAELAYEITSDREKQTPRIRATINEMKGLL